MISQSGHYREEIQAGLGDWSSFGLGLSVFTGFFETTRTTTTRIQSLSGDRQGGHFH